MSSKRRRTGIDHLTVVPENFEPPEDADADGANADEDETERSESAAPE